jgi:hypothetical protein
MIEIENSRFPGCTSRPIQQVKNFGGIGVKNAPEEYEDYFVQYAMACFGRQEPREYVVDFWILGISETKESEKSTYLVVDDTTCTYRGEAKTDDEVRKIGHNLKKTDVDSSWKPPTYSHFGYLSPRAW